MQAMDDMTLLREYAASNSETAFETLVSRRVGFVYSMALRQVRDPRMAEEVTQAVFIILAQKAGRISDKTILAGWLFRTTRFIALAQMRADAKRRQREQEANMQSEIQPTAPDLFWEQMSPLLDEALATLGETDRQAVLLRFFENKSLAEVGSHLSMGEDTARKRVSRALEKLHLYFSKRGVSSTTAIIAGAISANSVQAVPVTLVKSVTAMALAKGAAASTSTLTLIKGALKIMAWTKAKTAIVTGTAAILTIGTGVFIVEEIATPGGANAERGPVEMQIKWQAGKKYVMHREETQTSETKQPNQPKPVKQVFKRSTDYNFSLVRELDNGSRQLQLEFEGMALEVTAGDRTMFSADSTQNSAPDVENPVGVRLHKMVGARLQYFINANGKVEKMEGYQELVKRVAGENPQEQAAFRSLFNENMLKQFGSVGEDTTPSRVVKLGDSWAIRVEVPADIGILNLDLKCTFKNWEQRADHKCMRIKFAGDLSLQAAPNTPNRPVTIEKAKLSGEFWFDPELGMVVEMAFDVDMNVKIKQGGQILTASPNQKTRLTLEAVDDAAK
jgi:RNA polymerase sigma factor (sigma-70 family)